MARKSSILVYKESCPRGVVDIELHHRWHEKWYTRPAPHQQRGFETRPIFPVSAMACFPEQYCSSC